jgi:DNA-binding NtrC family response regulator
VIPPLRERIDDIIPLAQLFLQQSAINRKGTIKFLNLPAQEFLQSFPWPGNVRQLKNAMQRVDFMFESTELTPAHFSFLGATMENLEEGASPVFTVTFPDDSLSLYEVQKDFVTHALKLFKGNKTHTAKYLGISINKLRRIIGEM